MVSVFLLLLRHRCGIPYPNLLKEKVTPETVYFLKSPIKKYNICSSVDSSNFNLFRKITAPGVYVSTVEKRILSNGQLFFFIILKWLVWPVKSKRARGKNVEPIFTHFVFSVVLILQAAYPALKQKSMIRWSFGSMLPILFVFKF